MFGAGIIDNSTIKKYTEAFGSLFNDVRINHHDASGNVDSTLRVPLDFSSKSKWVRRIQELSSITDGPKVQIKLPRMGYELTGLSHSNQRQLTQTQKYNTNSSSSTSAGQFTMKRTPYDFDFALYILTNTQEEMWAILEQILPYFDPDMTIAINDNSDLQTSVNMVVNLEGKPSFTDNYEGPLKDSTSREIMCTLNFSVTGCFYGPVITGNLIEVVKINLYDADVDSRGDVLSIGDTEVVTITPTVSQSSFDAAVPADTLVVINSVG